MPLPPEMDKNIRKSFTELITSGNLIVEDSISEDNSHSYIIEEHVASYKALIINSTSIVRIVLGNTARGIEIHSEIADLGRLIRDVRTLVGILTALQYDYVNGYNLDLEEAILANVSSNYMSQAEALLGEGVAGQNDHVPAAVLCGAVLENRLRGYCENHDPPLPTTKPNGDSKTLGALIEELDKIKAFDKQTRKLLKAWSDIRNAAAHGKFDEFTREQVELMLLGVNGFLANHL